MNLVSLKFTLNAPIPRQAPLSILPKFRPEPWTGVMKTGVVEMALHDPSGPLGTVQIMAQVIQKELYEMQRHAAA